MVPFSRGTYALVSSRAAGAAGGPASVTRQRDSKAAAGDGWALAGAHAASGSVSAAQYMVVRS